MNIQVVFAILISVSVFIFCRSEYHCKAKPGCQIAQCDDSLWPHLLRNEFPITCVNDDAQRLKEQENRIIGLLVQLKEYQSEMHGYKKEIKKYKNEVQSYKRQVADFNKLTNALSRRLEKLESQSHANKTILFPASTSNPATEKPRKFTPWSDWTPCSETCGSGSSMRVRFCINDQESDATNCTKADILQSQPCTLGTCDQFVQWTSWSSCSATCGEGIMFRSKTCMADNCDDAQYLDDVVDVASCTLGPCYQFSQWSDWTQCSTSCGPGTTTRKRSCVSDQGNEALNITSCYDPLNLGGFQSQECSIEPCQKLSQWSEWSPCSDTCFGISKRFRLCLSDKGSDATNISRCPDTLHETQICSWGPCNLALPEPICQGVLYRNTCYFAIMKEVSSRDKALAYCSETDARLANIISDQHQDSMEMYLRGLIGKDEQYVNIWTALFYDPSTKTVKRSDGRVVSSIRWHPDARIGSQTGVQLVIHRDVDETHQGPYKVDGTRLAKGVLCER